MRKTVFIPVTLIQAANSEDWLRSLAYFVRLKSLYQNNTHYNFTLRSLAKKLSCSVECLRHHLQVLEREGLIRHHSGNLTFLGLWAIQKLLSKKCAYYTATVGVPVDKSCQLDLLRAQIIRFNLSAQSYNIKKSERQKCHKRQSRIQENHAMTESCYTGLSAVGIGSLFELSQTQGARIRATLKARGILQVTRKYQPIVKDVSFQHYKQMKRLQMIPVFSFYQDGCIWRERRTELQYCKLPAMHEQEETQVIRTGNRVSGTDNSVIGTGNHNDQSGGCLTTTKNIVENATFDPQRVFISGFPSVLAAYSMESGSNPTVLVKGSGKAVALK